jgi:hypothetical protein
MASIAANQRALSRIAGESGLHPKHESPIQDACGCGVRVTLHLASFEAQFGLKSRVGLVFLPQRRRATIPSAIRYLGNHRRRVMPASVVRTRIIGHAAVVIFMVASGATVVSAQQPAKDQDAVLRNSPDLKLTPEQKQTIYTSVSNKPKNQTVPSTFRVAVGEAVPASIELEPMPPTIVQLMPQTKGFQFAMVTNQVLLIDGENRRIVEIITH